MKKSMTAIMIVTMVLTVSAGCGQNSSSATSQVSASSDVVATSPSAQNDQDGDGIPDTVEKTYGTNPYTADTDGDGINDKEDQTPTFTENLIHETSSVTLPVSITDSRVEDNATADHLEITFTNQGTTILNSFDIYYTIKDKVNTDQVEGYYQKLNGLSVAPGESVTLHFDNNVSQPNHYYGNMNGLYGTSANGLTFSVSLHADGYQPLDFNVEKSDGTAEVAD